MADDALLAALPAQTPGQAEAADSVDGNANAGNADAERCARPETVARTEQRRPKHVGASPKTRELVSFLRINLTYGHCRS